MWNWQITAIFGCLMTGNFFAYATEKTEKWIVHNHLNLYSRKRSESKAHIEDIFLRRWSILPQYKKCPADFWFPFYSPKEVSQMSMINIIMVAYHCFYLKRT